MDRRTVDSIQTKVYRGEKQLEGMLLYLNADILKDGNTEKYAMQETNFDNRWKLYDTFKWHTIIQWISINITQNAKTQNIHYYNVHQKHLTW